MTRLAAFLTSSVGRKVLMGLTGLAMIGFLALHLAGNLLIFAGAATFNAYSHALISNPLIYLAEAGLLLLFVSHFATGLVVTQQNWNARPIDYEMKRRAGHSSRKSVASSTMIVSGLVLLAFVPLHLWAFKFGPYYPFAGELHTRDLYRLAIEIFQQPAQVGLYVVTLAIIGFHLWHGFESAFESLGLRPRPLRRRIGQLLALVLTFGFVVIPVLLFVNGGRP